MYTYIWEYKVKNGCEKDFEKSYGKEGDWVKLFTGKDGYIKTEIYRDEERVGIYLTFDKWESKEKYEEFMQNYKVQFNEIDKKCEELTEWEKKVGEYESV